MFEILRLSVFPWCKDSPQLVWTHLCRFFLRVVGVRESGPPILVSFLAFVVKVGVVTTEASKSEKLREWNGIFYVLWMTGRM